MATAKQTRSEPPSLRLIQNNICQQSPQKPILDTLLAFLLIALGNNGQSQDTIGIYFRHAQLPDLNEELIEYKQLFDAISLQTNGDFMVGMPFPHALRAELTWMRKITVTNHSDYAPVEFLLDNSQLFDIVLPIQGGQIHNSAPSSAYEFRRLDTLPDPPDCLMPYTPNDPEYFIQEHYQNMQLPCALTVTQGNPDITVGIVDYYFDLTNTDLAGKWRNTPSCPPIVSNGEYLRTVDRHGTAMAGGIAAGLDNSKCVAGTGGNTTVKGYCNPSFSAVLETFHDAVNDDNHIINISIQGPEFDDDNAEARECVRNVFLDAVDRGKTVTFAVNGINSIHLTDIPGVLLVGSGYENGAYKPYRRGGFDDVGIEFILPAYRAFTMDGPDACAKNDGESSLGAAFLAGIVGLMLDVNPCLTPADIEDILWNTSQDVPNRDCCYPTYFEPGKGKVNAYQAVLAAQNFAGHLSLVVVDGETETIENTTLRYNDIKVETGGVLKLNNSTIYIDGNNSGPYQNGRIVVERGAKLIVRNSLLTTSTTSDLCAENDWSGIRVHGNIDLPQPNMYDANGNLQVNTTLQPNESGVVILLQGTTLEKAYNAISTAAPGYPYPDQVDRWGGLIIADNVTFRNNFRAAEFLQYPRRNSGNTFTNQSTFNNCDFITEDEADDRSLGITLWDTDGVTVTQSSFQNLGRESILTIDGSFVVENGNRFSNDVERPFHRHLSTLKTYPYDETSRIGSEDVSLLPNVFLTKDAEDVFIHCADIDPADPVVIINNEFAYEGALGSRDDAPAGIELVGPQRFRILDNLFDDCELPVVLDNTGTDGFPGGNIISCNTFNNSNGPLRLENNNEGTQLAQNTFSGAPVFGQISSNLRWDGLTDFRQGSIADPANNVFSNTGAQRDITALTSTNFFQYWYTDDGSGNTNFFEPRGAEISYAKETTIDISSNLCGQGIPPGIQGPNSPTKIDTVRSKLAVIEGYLASNPNDTAKLIERQEIKLELEQRVNQYVYISVGRGEIDSAVTVLNTLKTAAAEMRTYGIYVGAGRYAEAAAKLPLINDYGLEYDEFVYVQNVNLDRLTDTLPYVLTPKVKAELTKYAGGKGKFRSYSRALLTLLEDERYYDDWGYSMPSARPNVDTLEVERLRDLEFGADITVFPNPSSGTLQIRGQRLARLSSIEILSTTGRLLRTIPVHAREQLHLELDVAPGVYFLLFHGPDHVSYRKIIIR